MRNNIGFDEWSAMMPDGMRSIMAMRAELAGKSERPAPNVLFTECRRLALAHIAAGTEDAPSWTARLSGVTRWLRSKGAAVDDDAVRSEANTLVLALYVW